MSIEFLMSKFSSRILILHHQKQTTLKGVKLFKSNKISNMASQFLNKEACHLDSQANKLDVAAPSPRRTGASSKDGYGWLNIRIIRIRIRLKCQYEYSYSYSILLCMYPNSIFRTFLYPIKFLYTRNIRLYPYPQRKSD